MSTCFFDIVVFATLFAGETFQKDFQTNKVLNSTDTMSLLWRCQERSVEMYEALHATEAAMISQGNLLWMLDIAEKGRHCCLDVHVVC